MSDIQETIIGSGTYFNGELDFEKSAKIVGDFEGAINGSGTLHITENAICKAEINVAQVIIDGTVEGNVTASERVELNAKGAVLGDITAPKMVISDGASLDGILSVGGGASGASGAGAKTSTSTSTTSGASSAQAAPPEPRPAEDSNKPSGDGDTELDEILKGS